MSKEKYRPGVEYFNYKKPPGPSPEGYRWILAKRHPEKNYPISWILVNAQNEVPPNIDELPPFDVEGPLLKNKPLDIGGITSQQVERSKNKGGPTTHAARVAEALERKEND